MVKNLTWTRNGQMNLLISDGQPLITLRLRSATAAEFELNNKTYRISTKGLWNPVCSVHQDDREVLRLSYGFWRSKGKIIFNDGSEYDSEYRSKGGLKLRFLNNGNEILSYGYAFENRRPVLVFSLGTDMIDAEKLLILAALGMTIYTGIFKEISGDIDSTTAALLASIA
mgnify:CR=1 FL=1